jgi:hypothetical protein
MPDASTRLKAAAQTHNSPNMQLCHIWQAARCSKATALAAVVAATAAAADATNK